MLNERYKYDGIPILNLNSLQLDQKKIIEEKIKSDKYKFESVNCIVCDNSDFELLAEKDRYGLYVSTMICKKCGLIQTNPRMDQESYNEFYDGEYRRLHRGSKVATKDEFEDQKFHGRAVLDLIERKCGKITDKFVVEIGTGAGGILQVFKEAGNRVFGVDLGSDYIDYGKQLGLNLKVGTVKELRKLKVKPDVVIYAHVLEHILNPKEELLELRKYLKKTSIIYIEVPGVKNLMKTYNQNFLTYLQNAHIYHYSLKTLTNITNKAGFELVYGNECINSIFKLGYPKPNYDCDYVEVINFLHKLEKNRFNLYKIRNFLFSSLEAITKKTKTRDIARKIYHHFKYDN